MEATIIAVGNGGYHLAIDIINTGIIDSPQLIVCDTNTTDLERNSEKATKTVLLEKYRGKVRIDKLCMIKGVLEDTLHTTIICTTLGGITGSRFAPLISADAILKGKFVCSLFSTPYNKEGELKERRAANARMQLIASSNFVIQQNNEQLNNITNMVIENINKPLVDTLKSALVSYSFEELSKLNNSQTLIPECYHLDGMPLIWIRSDCYRGITEKDRIELFDSLS